MPEFHLINFGPFTNNVLDYIGKPLITRGGRIVELTRRGMNFEIVIEPMMEPIASTPDNLSASYVLNQYEVGEMQP